MKEAKAHEWKEKLPARYLPSSRPITPVNKQKMKAYSGSRNGLDYVASMPEVILSKASVRAYIDETVSSRYGGR